MKIPLKEAIDRLLQSTAVIVENEYLVFHKVFPLDECFLSLCWDNIFGDHKVIFNKANNSEVSVTKDGRLMFLRDTENKKVQLTLLVEATFE